MQDRPKLLQPEPSIANSDWRAVASFEFGGINIMLFS